MSDFISALAEYRFLQLTLLTSWLASAAVGVVGSYVVVRRITYIAGGIAHCVLGGIGAAKYFSVVHGWTWFQPMIGAIAAALAAATIIGLVSLRARQREDTIIGATWALGMAAGVLFIWNTPGYNEELSSYLFGSYLLVQPRDIWLLAGLDLIILVLAILFYPQFLAVCFDEEFARLRGVNVELFYLLLLALTALTVVLLVNVVGIIMVIALLTLPVAVAGFLTVRLWQMMLVAALLSILLTTSGLALSYNNNWPAGATTIVLAGLLYLAALLIRPLWKRLRPA